MSYKHSVSQNEIYQNNMSQNQLSRNMSFVLRCVILYTVFHTSDCFCLERCEKVTRSGVPKRIVLKCDVSKSSFRKWLSPVVICDDSDVCPEKVD
jgi:hypothetical protein